MRHIGDTLVWVALILLVAGVVYYTPRVADYVASIRGDQGQGLTASHEMVFNHQTGTVHVDR